MRKFALAMLQLAVKAVVVTVAVMGAAGILIAHFAFGGNVSLQVSDDFATGLSGHLHNPPGSADFRIVATGPQNLLTGPVTVVVSERTSSGTSKTFRAMVQMFDGVANYSYQPLDPSADTLTFTYQGAAQTVSFLEGDYTSQGYTPGSGTVRTVQSPNGGNTLNNPQHFSDCAAFPVGVPCDMQVLAYKITSIPQQVVTLLEQGLVDVVNSIIVGWLQGLLSGLSGMIALILQMPYLGTAFGGIVYSFWGAFLVLGLLFWLFVFVIHLIAVSRGKPPGLVPRLTTMGVTFIAMYYSLGLTDLFIRFANGISGALFAHWAPSVTGSGVSAGQAMFTLAGIAISPASPILAAIWLAIMAAVVAVFALGAFINMAFFGVISPLMIAWGALAKDYMRSLGYLLLLLRAAFVPVLIGIAWLVMAHATGLAVMVGAGVGAIYVDNVMLLILVVVLVVFWFVPMIKWFLNPLLMGADQAGSFLGKVGDIGGTALSMVGMATGQPELMAAGAAVKTFGNQAKAIGQSLKAGAEGDYIDTLGGFRDLMNGPKDVDTAKRGVHHQVVRPVEHTAQMRGQDGTEQEYTGWRAPNNVKERAVQDLRAAGIDARAKEDSFWVPKADRQKADQIVGQMFLRHKPYWQADDGSFMGVEGGQSVKLNSPPRNGIFMGQWGGGEGHQPPDLDDVFSRAADFADAERGQAGQEDDWADPFSADAAGPSDEAAASRDESSRGDGNDGGGGDKS